MEFIFDKDYVNSLIDKEDYSTLWEYTKNGASLGNPDAMCCVGMCYLEGYGVKQDEEKAFSFFENADKNGSFIAKRFIAHCYRRGNVVSIDYRKALNLYYEAANAGDAVAWRCIGNCYKNGIGIKKSLRKAINCYSFAYKLGDKKSANMIANYYAEQPGKKRFTTEAIHWYELSNNTYQMAIYHISKYAKNKDFELSFQYFFDIYYDPDFFGKDFGKEWAERLAYEKIGDVFYDGIYARKDFIEAIKWYRKAASLGAKNLFFTIAECYLKGGHGLKKNIDLAKEYLTQAADLNNDDNAMYLLGLLLLPTEPKLANQYITKSIKAGNKEAKKYIKKFSEKRKSKLYTPAIVRTSFVKRLALKLLKDEIAQFETERRQRDREIEDKNKRISTLEDDVTFFRDEISSGIKAVDENITSVGRQLYEHDKKVDALLGTIQKLKTEFIDEVNKTTKNTEELLTKYLEEATSTITKNVKYDESLFAIHEQEMKKIFDKNWEDRERIPSMAKDALVSASVLWDKCSDIKDERFDYSGICILATSAFEDIIKKIFFTDFLRYYKKEYNVHEPSLLECPDTLLFFKQNTYETAIAEYDKENHGDSSKYACTFLWDKNVTIGSIPYIFTKYVSDIAKNNSDRAFVQYKQAINRKVFVEYLQSIVKDEYKENPLESFSLFVSHCETINKNFRNEAAHTKHIEIEKAAQCYAAIIGPNNKIEAYRKMINIEAVLLELFSKLK